MINNISEDLLITPEVSFVHFILFSFLLQFTYSLHNQENVQFYLSAKSARNRF